MTLRKLLSKECASLRHSNTSIRLLHPQCSQHSFASSQIPTDVKAHIERLKNIAAESNQQHLLPQTNILHKSKHRKTSKSKHSKYVDKYSFSFKHAKLEHTRMRQKEKLTKALTAMQSNAMPLSQGRVIDSPAYFDLSVDDALHRQKQLKSAKQSAIKDAAEKLPLELRDVLSKFTENSERHALPMEPVRASLPSIPIPKIDVESFDYTQEMKHVQTNTHTKSRPINRTRHSNFSKSDENANANANANAAAALPAPAITTSSDFDTFHHENTSVEDEQLENDALQSSQQRHQKQVQKLTRSLSAAQQQDTAWVSEFVESKQRESANRDRQHFYIKHGKSSFGDVGVSDLLCERLQSLGFTCPSMIQALFIKQFHAMENKRSTMVMGAETGSGKTLAFVIPIIDDFIEEYIAMDVIRFNTSEGAGVGDAVDVGDGDGVGDAVGDEDNARLLTSTSSSEISLANMKVVTENLPFLRYPKCVIVEPNAELCRQVRGVVQSVARIFGIRVHSWTEEDTVPPPIPCLYDYLYSFYDDAHNIHDCIESAPEILVCTPSVLKHVFDVRFVLRLHYLVMDEADLMLTHKAGKGKWAHVEQLLKTLQKYQKDKLLGGWHSHLYTFTPCMYIFSGATLANKRVRVFLGQSGVRSRKQRATPLPDTLMRLFQKSTWVVSPYQHRHSPNLALRWLFVRDHLEQQELLLRALHRHPAQKNRYKIQKQAFPALRTTIIFCNSRDSVESAVAFLQHHRIPCVGLHDKMHVDKRDSILHSFFNDKKHPILVATDMVSRGYDFGCCVECVIQLDFAKTPDIHYNRVGRTARAGRKGLAINLYMNNSAVLVKQLVGVARNNERIDSLFRNKIRNRLTPRQRKKMVKMGLKPPPTVKEMAAKYGVRPKKKIREFRFDAAKTATHQAGEKKNK